MEEINNNIIIVIQMILMIQFVKIALLVLTSYEIIVLKRTRSASNV